MGESLWQIKSAMRYATRCSQITQETPERACLEESRRRPPGLLPDSINTMLSIFISISILSISSVQSLIHSVNLKSSAEN